MPADGSAGGRWAEHAETRPLTKGAPMTGRTVLVTGVTRFLGSTLAGRLAADSRVDRVIGVDAALPDPAARARMGTAEFARADIRNPLIARVIEAAGVDTVVHASASAAPVAAAARTMAKEMNVLGTMQLLAACQRAPTVAHLVVRSTSAVYGGSSKDPAIFTEETAARAAPSSSAARDAVDIEGCVRGFSRRRPDVRVAVPRFAEIIGPTVRSPLTRYFSLAPGVPVALGHDARLQFVHEQDAIDVLEHLTLGGFAGTVNVAGDGTLTLIQAIRRAGRVPLPVPMAAMDAVGRLLKIARIGGFSAQQVRLLTSGRVLDTTRLGRDAGFACRYTSLQAFDDFVTTITPVLGPAAVRAAELRVAGALGVRPLPDPDPRARPRHADGQPAAPASSGERRAHLVSIDGQGSGRAGTGRRRVSR
jgi:UDP-glucose 4-epimerase